MKNFIVFVLLLLLISVAGCDDEKETNGYFKITLQGTEQDVRITKATLTVSGGQNTSSGHASHTLRLAGKFGNDSISISISNWDFQLPPDHAIITKEYYNVYAENEDLCLQASENVTICEGVLIKYFEGNKTFSSIPKNEATLIVHISKCDGKMVSGTFGIELENIHDNEDVRTVSGELKDVPYTVRNVL